MSERKRGGLDYTARAFPGARDPDGPAPDLEDQLAKLGLVEREDTKAVRSGASAGANVGASAGAKKRSALEYTPQAFPGARDPDGPAPGLEDRLVQMGLAERTEARAPEPRHRQERTHTPEPPRKERTASPPAPQVFTPSPPLTPREPVVASPPARIAPSAATPVPPRQERAASRPPRPAPSASQQPFTATQQPVYVVPPPSSISAIAPAESPLTLTPSLPLPPVPPEVPPRPAPIISASAASGANLDISAAAQPAPRPAARPARRIAVPKQRPEQEERIRRSVRLVASVDAKLNDLAHLRGLDLNTAVGVAIVADWVACFGPRGQSLKGQAS